MRYNGVDLAACKVLGFMHMRGVVRLRESSKVPPPDLYIVGRVLEVGYN